MMLGSFDEDGPGTGGGMNWGLLLAGAVLIVSLYPEAIPEAIYRVRLWWAHRGDQTNYARLRHMRAQIEAGRYADDLAPATPDK